MIGSPIGGVRHYYVSPHDFLNGFSLADKMIRMLLMLIIVRI